MGMCAYAFAGPFLCVVFRSLVMEMLRVLGLCKL